jgi:glycine betaine/proline transport system substrate-binding protein
MLNLAMFPIPQLPVAAWVESATNWITVTFSGLFDIIQNGGTAFMNGITSLLLLVPPFAMILFIAIVAYFASNRRLSLSAFTLVGLGYILNQGLWAELMNTVTLVFVSSIISILIGVPLGIWSAKNTTVHNILKPLLDFMQTMPAFVYLIPAVAFFGIGIVPGAFASVIFALPPTVRFTELGINQISEELIEAADAFGSTPRQKLFKVELPLAKSTIMAGINQSVMLALSMVVTASMIGAPGLGRQVLTALQRASVGSGFVAGLAIVVLAILIDRLTNRFTNK